MNAPLRSFFSVARSIFANTSAKLSLVTRNNKRLTFDHTYTKNIHFFVFVVIIPWHRFKRYVNDVEIDKGDSTSLLLGKIYLLLLDQNDH